MTGFEIFIACGGGTLFGGIVGGAVSWGYMKGEKKIFVTHPDHRQLCHDRAVELHSKIDNLSLKIEDQTLAIVKALGKVEGKLEGKVK